MRVWWPQRGATAWNGPGGGLWGGGVEGQAASRQVRPMVRNRASRGVVERVGGVEVADGVGGGVELVEGDAGFEEALGVVEGLELVIGGHHVAVVVALGDAALGVEGVGGEQAGAVVVEEGREHVLCELVDLGGEAARDVAVAEVLAHYAGVLALGEGVVVAVAGA